MQSLRDEKCFASLDKGLQHVVVCLANSQTSLATLTAQEATQTRSHITTQVQQLEQLRIAKEHYDEVSNSGGISYRFQDLSLVAFEKLFCEVLTIVRRSVALCWAFNGR